MRKALVMAAALCASAFASAAPAAVLFDWNDGTTQGWGPQGSVPAPTNVSSQLSWDTNAGFTQIVAGGSSHRSTIVANPILSVEVTPSTAPGGGQFQQVALFVEGSTGTTSFNRTGPFTSMPDAGETYIATLDTTGLPISPSSGYLNLRMILNTTNSTATGNVFNPGAVAFDNYGANPVPEPVAAGLFLIGGMFALGRRRRATA